MGFVESSIKQPKKEMTLQRSSLAQFFLFLPSSLRSSSFVLSFFPSFFSSFFLFFSMVGTLQLPRLTAALRESHRGPGSSSLNSIESIYLASQELLKQKQAKPLSQEDSEFVESVLSASFFLLFFYYYFMLFFFVLCRHEKEIWGRLSALDKAEDSKKRQLFRQYLKKVKELVGEQSDPAQTSSSAVFLFKTLTDAKGAEPGSNRLILAGDLMI